MKLNEKTIHVLKNFSSINPGINIKPGNVLATISPNKTVMARATVPDEFETRCSLYNLNQFLGALSLFENGELEFGQKSVMILGENRNTEYFYCEESVIVSPPDKEIKLPSVDVTCNLSNKDIQQVVKALGVLGLPELAIVGDGASVHLQAVDSKSPTSNIFSIKIGETDKAFRAIFRSENLRMMDGDYEVRLSSRNISQFVGTDVTYWIAVEASSTW